MEFPDTNWTMLAIATMNGGQPEREAMDQLCREYWKPVAACIRKRGAPSDRIDDLTQEFFLKMVDTGFFKKANPAKGSFRSFVLASLRYFLADDVKYQTAQKRGGHLERSLLTDESVTSEFDDTYFDRAWAKLVFDRAIEKTSSDTGDDEGSWEHLKSFLPGTADMPSYEELGAVLGMTPGAAKTRVFRMRQSFRENLRAEIGRTVSAPHEIDEELAHLRTALEQGQINYD